MNLELKYKNNDNIFNEHFDAKVPYLSFKIFDEFDWLINAFTTRHGGVSKDYYSSLNLSYAQGDDPELVNTNFRKLGEELGIDYNNMVCSNQTHTTNILAVDNHHKGQGITMPHDFKDIDGLVTNVPGIALVTIYADCVPLYFVDPVNKAIAVSHSGWRGTVNKIAKVTIEKLKELYGSKPEDIICAIGPSICQDCYEVSEDVINEFKSNFNEEYYNELFYKKENSKYQLNLWKACELTLLESGIKKENLKVTNICTCCNSEHLFSHRASKGKRGNLAALLYIKL